jgi:hypothetical protein
MADQIYKVRDPQGNIREIKGPAGASDDEVIAQAQKLFTAPAPAAASEVPGPRSGPSPYAAAPSNPTLKALYSPFVGAYRGLQDITDTAYIAATEAMGIKGAREESARQKAQFEQQYGGTVGGEVGRVGGQVVGTLPVGGAIAAPLKKFAPALAQAVRTGGFSTGRAVANAPLATRAGDIALRAAGGAATGGATAALINPEEAESGALFGAGTALVAPPIVKTLAKGAGFLKDAFTGQLAAVKAGKISRDVAGDQIATIRAALAAAPDDLTAAQATAGVQKNAFQALGKFASRTDEMSLKLKQQAAADFADLQRMMEGGNATEARAAYEASIKRLNQLTADMRNVELQAANQAAQTANRLAPQLQQREASMVNALRGGMPTGAVSQPQEAARRIGPLEMQVGRPAVGQAGAALPGQAVVSPTTEAAQQAATAAKGKPGFLSAGDRAKEWQETSDIFADIAKQRRAEAGFIERQIGSLEDYGLRPLDAGSIIGAIDARLSQPGLRASPNVVKVLEAIKGDIANLTAKGGGVIDANDLYTLRKEGINERIAQIMGQTDPKISAKVTRRVLEDIRPLIDDAIETAAGPGGPGWRNYLKTYSQGMQAIDQKAMAAEAAKLFKDSPQEYMRLVRGDNTDAVEAIFGPGSYDIFKEMGSKMPTLEKLASNIDRTAGMETAAALGKEELAAIIERAGRTFPRIRNTLNPKITFANLTMDELEGRLGPKVAAKLKSGMVSGKSALEMLNTLPAVERGAVLRMLNNPSTWGAKGAAGARAATSAVTPTNALAGESENQNALAR